ncbi:MULTISPECIES: hypothetical protein [Leptospira]|uniref:hypothetical protein n=1 Tax=Leptospira TaxID=171 RepID=UPI00214C6C4C|nr:hypothetical protein [Leptospira sp. id769339]MCR1795724.1 hypothetical protein [Leptospira sp. id769339]
MSFKFKKSIGISTAIGFFVLVACSSLFGEGTKCPMNFGKQTSSIDREASSPCHATEKKDKERSNSGDGCCDSNLSISTAFDNKEISLKSLHILFKFVQVLFVEDKLYSVLKIDINSNLFAKGISLKPFYSSNAQQVFQVFLI